MRAVLAISATLAATSAASDFVLQQPADCILGETCHIQNYVDRDPGPGVQDFSCAGLSYDGHKGTDFALATRAEMEKGVSVLAAADGVARGIRDGMEDRLYSADNASAIEGRECGNGVVIVHDDGWETQYCHLKEGSVQVASGDRVSAGDVIGEIGLSGKTQFPHVHLSVRQNGNVVDPFAPDSAAQCGAAQNSLWAEDIRYEPGALLSVGFADKVPEYSDVLAGSAARDTMPVDANAIVLFGLAFGSQKDDILRLTIHGPKGAFLAQDVVLEKPQAQVFRATGRRLTSTEWPSGTYHGEVVMLRDGKAISQKTVSMTVN